MVVSAFSATQQQAILLAFLIMMPEMIFSGYAVPVENMPRALELASNLVPIKHWLEIVRAVMLKGWVWRQFGPTCWRCENDWRRCRWGADSESGFRTAIASPHWPVSLFDYNPKQSYNLGG